MDEQWTEMLAQVRANTTNDREVFFNLAALLAEKINFHNPDETNAKWLQFYTLWRDDYFL